MNSKLLLFFFFSFFIWAGCEDNFVSRDFPSVLTISVTEERDGSILFSGRLVARGSSSVDEVGFIWQSSAEPDFSNGYKANLSGKVKEGPFSLSVFTSIKKNTEYYVKAYARVGEVNIYGDTWIFVSTVDFQPPQFSLTTKTGHAGDTIEISGGLLNRSIEKNFVSFDNLQAEIVEVYDSSLRCIVPLALENKQSSVTVSCDGLSTILTDKFTLVTPEIISFSPAEVPMLDTLLIIGRGFHTIKDLNIVKIGAYRAQVLSNSATTLSVLVPFTSDSLCFISVTVSGQTVTSESRLKVPLPEFDYFSPPEAGFLDTLAITIKKLNPDAVTGIKFGDVNGRIISVSDTLIEVEVPALLNKEFTDLKVILQTGEFVFGYKFHLKQPEIFSINKTEFHNLEYVTVYGKYFNPGALLNRIILVEKISGSELMLYPEVVYKDSLKFRIKNPLAPSGSIPSGNYDLGVQTCEHPAWANTTLSIIDIWRRLGDFPGGARYKGAAVSSGGYGFAGLGAKLGNNMQRDIWKFDPLGESWTLVSNLPGQGRIYPFVFSNESFVFIGGGQSLDNNESQVPYKDFYRFDPSNNSWLRLKDAPSVEKSYPGASSSPTGNIHVANLSTGSLREYSSSSDEWLETYTGNGAANKLPMAFSIAGKTYFVCGNNNELTNGSNNQVWEYDPSSNTMIRKKDFPGLSRYGGFGFSIGNHGYIGCGVTYVYNGSIQYLDDVWRYNPGSDSWTQFPSFPPGVRLVPVSFVVGNKAYILTGYDSSSLKSDVWEFFDPDNK